MLTQNDKKISEKKKMWQHYCQICWNEVKSTNKDTDGQFVIVK